MFVHIAAIVISVLCFSNRSMSIKEQFRPAVAATWKFGEIAVDVSSTILADGGSAIEAVEKGIRAVELDNQDQYFVGVGGLPNRDGMMELDAAIMDHHLRYGAVMSLQNIKTPISVARSIMEKCVHNILCGDGAYQWAIDMGFVSEPDVLTESSKQQWLNWKNNNIIGHDKQVINNSNTNTKNDISMNQSSASSIIEEEDSHDTVGVICLDQYGHLCAGTSTSGWKFKHPGRVGDSPLVGSGLYCHGEYGAAVATGDGEEIMRTCLSYLVVEYMRQGCTPQEACTIGIQRMLELNEINNCLDYSADNSSTPTTTTNTEKKMHAQLTVGVIAMNPEGVIGAASTLSVTNPHRGRPGFPVVTWKSSSVLTGTNTTSNTGISSTTSRMSDTVNCSSSSSSSSSTKTGVKITMEASIDGATC